MPRDEFSHLEHADLLLATKDHLQRVIGVDQSPLLLVLELVLLDVIPQLFGHLANFLAAPLTVICALRSDGRVGFFGLVAGRCRRRIYRPETCR